MGSPFSCEQFVAGPELFFVIMNFIHNTLSELNTLETLFILIPKKKGCNSEDECGLTNYIGERVKEIANIS